MRQGTRVLLLLCASIVLAGLARAADVPSFKKRGGDDKQFANQVAEAVIKAAHGTAKNIVVKESKFTNPKANRTDLAMKVEYHGAVTNKAYLADVVVKIDSTNKEAWEVLNIDYSDNNNVPYNEKKIQALVRQLNR